jgi:hypothetical protein
MVKREGVNLINRSLTPCPADDICTICAWIFDQESLSADYAD